MVEPIHSLGILLCEVNVVGGVTAQTVMIETSCAKSIIELKQLIAAEVTSTFYCCLRPGCMIL